MPSARQTARRVTALSLGLAVAGILLLVIGDFTGPEPDVRVPWLVMVAAFVAAEHFAVHVEFGDNAHSLSFVELAIVIGLLFTSPVTLVSARLVGGIASLALLSRQSRLKLIFNSGYFLFEIALAIGTYYWVVGLVDGVVGVWLAAMASALCTSIAGTLAVTAVISLKEAERPDLNLTMKVGAVGSLGELAVASLALVAATMLQVHVAGGLLVASPLVVAYLGYRALLTIQQRHRTLQQLYEVTKSLSEAPELTSTMRLGLDRARDVLHSEWAELVVVNATGESPPFCARVDQDGVLQLRAVDEIDEELILKAFDSRQEPLVIGRKPGDEGEAALLAERDARDLMAAPLTNSRDIRGALIVWNRLGDVRSYDDEDARVLAALSNQTAMSIERSTLADRLRIEVAENEYNATHDQLTGLGNRQALVEWTDRAVERAARNADKVCVLLLDLNRFKEVNDTLGHRTGDLLLEEVAGRLSAVAPVSAQLARLGGDEFAVLLPSVSDIEEAVDVAARFRERLRRPIELGGISLAISAAIGIASFPTDGDHASLLLQRADIAMYTAKEPGSAGIERYQEERDQHSTQRLALAGELSKAIAGRLLTVDYQPKAAIGTGQIIGVEALVRWQHPTLGLIAPEEFVALAARVGLMPGLTRFVIEEALDQVRAWDQAGLGLGVAINLSALTLVDADILDVLDARTSESAIDRSRVTLEVTESEMMTDFDNCISSLRRLHDRGFRIAIDDFGTGYSSLSYLRQLPADELKVDKSFVQPLATDSIEDSSIVRTVIELAHSLGMRSVAEGVEDRVTWDILEDLGCDIVQGHYLSRPLPADELTDWLVTRLVRASTRIPGSA